MIFRNFRNIYFSLLLICLGSFFSIHVIGKQISHSEYTKHVRRLKRRVPADTFTVIIQKPFVVISDEEPETVKDLSESVVDWAVKKLKYMYFKKDPHHIINIWLFNGEASYRKYTWRFFRDRPDTPFGYSSPEQRALIMNIKTGGGTLVHEIVHPYMRANFSRCPAWFNEGLASLYEQSRGKGKKIVGMLNWRLPGLKKEIRRSSLPTFKHLMSTSAYEFYEKDPGSNYAQSRYLCYYLQEKGLLMEFFHAFLKNHKKDPTGFQTMKRILKEKDMGSFQKKWEKFIMNLKRTE